MGERQASARCSPAAHALAGRRSTAECELSGSKPGTRDDAALMLQLTPVLAEIRRQGK